MQLRVGRIPFLVCAPFFYRFLTQNDTENPFFFEDGVPSQVNQLLAKGKIHLTPGSSLNYALHADALVLAPHICTSCRTEVQSVALFSNLPIEELYGQNVHLTNQSATSVALLKLLFRAYFKIKVRYIQNETFDSSIMPARLLIGDNALTEREQKRFAYIYDLGELWNEWQKMPFVFGAWSIHQSALAVDYRALLNRFLEEVELSVKEFLKAPEPALDVWKKHYPVSFSLETLRSYYSVLDYTFSDERKESLSRFFELCADYDLLPSAPKLKFLKI